MSFHAVLAYRFRLEPLSREPTVLKAAVVLNDTLNYNQRMIYHFQIEATVSKARTGNREQGMYGRWLNIAGGFIQLPIGDFLIRN